MSEAITSSVAAEVAAEVRAELARQRKPQRQLGEVIGLSQTAAWRRLKGDIPFDVAELDKIADWLGVPLANFFPERSAA